MLAPRRGLGALSSGILRRISSYGSIRYASSVEAPAIVDEEGDRIELPAEEIDPKPQKKRSTTRKKAEDKEKDKEKEPSETATKKKKKKSSSSSTSSKVDDEAQGDEAKAKKKKSSGLRIDKENSPWSTSESEGKAPAPLLKTLKTLKVMLTGAKGDQEVLKRKLADYAGPFSLAALERAMAGSTPDVALQLFRWATSRPEFCYDQKAVHRFVAVLRNGDKLEEARAFIADELNDHPEVQRMGYSAIYIGYVNGKNNDKAEEVLKEMTERGITPHPSALNRLLLMRWDRDGVDGMLELHREHKAKGWQVDAAGHNQVIGGLCRADKLDEAMEVLLESSGKVEHYEGTYQVLVTALCVKGRMDDALKVADQLFSVMGVRSRCNPLKVFLNRLVEAKRYDDAMRLFERILEVTQPSDSRIVSLLCKDGELDRAIEVAEMMKRYDVKYNLELKALVTKLCEAKRVSEARKVFDIMVESGVSPDAETCTNLAMCSAKPKAEEDEVGGGDGGDGGDVGGESEDGESKEDEEIGDEDEDEVGAKK